MESSSRRPRSNEIFSRYSRKRASWSWVYVDHSINSEERCSQKAFEDARKKRSASNEEDKEELIEIDQEILNLLLAAPNINKGIFIKISI